MTIIRVMTADSTKQTAAAINEQPIADSNLSTLSYILNAPSTAPKFYVLIHYFKNLSFVRL